jgi:hypothetical protein
MRNNDFTHITAIKRYQNKNKTKHQQNGLLIFDKTCSICKQIKSTMEFPKDLKTKDGFRYQCKECYNYYKKQKYKNDPNGSIKNYQRTQVIRKRNRLFIYNYLQNKKCVDCVESRWQVLDFDHVKPGKISNISDMVHNGFSIKNLQKEIDKCEIRCANCHRMKTFIQLEYYKDIL